METELKTFISWLLRVKARHVVKYEEDGSCFVDVGGCSFGFDENGKMVLAGRLP